MHGRYPPPLPALLAPRGSVVLTSLFLLPHARVSIRSEGLAVAPSLDWPNLSVGQVAYRNAEYALLYAAAFFKLRTGNFRKKGKGPNAYSYATALEVEDLVRNFSFA